jgi:hypothetical protein
LLLAALSLLSPGSFFAGIVVSGLTTIALGLFRVAGLGRDWRGKYALTLAWHQATVAIPTDGTGVIGRTPTFKTATRDATPTPTQID